MQFDTVARLLYIGALAVFLTFCALLPFHAYAQTSMLKCLPDTASSVRDWFVSKDGGCAWFSCTASDGTRPRYAFCGTIDELPKVGSRIQTIAKSADPLKSAQTADQRYPVGDLREPRFDALRAQMCDRGGPCIAASPASAASAP